MRDRFEDIYNTAVAHVLLSSSFQRFRISCLHHSNVYCRRVHTASTEICRFLFIAANANIGLHTSSLFLYLLAIWFLKCGYRNSFTLSISFFSG